VTHVIRPLAKDDIIRQLRYYLFADAPEVAGKFLDFEVCGNVLQPPLAVASCQSAGRVLKPDKFTDGHYQVVYPPVCLPQTFVGLLHALVGLSHALVDLARPPISFVRHRFKVLLNPIETSTGFGSQIANQLLKGDLVLSQDLDYFLQPVDTFAMRSGSHAFILAQHLLAQNVGREVA